MLNYNQSNLLLLSKQHLWGIKLRYLWLGIQILLITVAFIYGYLDKKTFSIILPLCLLFILVNLGLHIKTSVDKKNLSFLNYQIEGDLVLFVSFLLLSGGTQNPFYPFFFLLVFLLGFSANVKGPWIKGLIVFIASLSLQILPYITIEHVSIFSSQTYPYLFIHFAIPLITFFIAHSLGKKLFEAHSLLGRIQKKEDRMSRLKALGAMSAGLSHEFASPLHAAQLRLERIKRSQGESDDINECILALEDCSRTLLLMSKIHHDLELTTLEKISEKTLNEIINQWIQANPRVKIKLDLKNFVIEAPRLSFIQTIFNILDNAYETQTTPTIEITSYNLNIINIITIKDNGPGIPKDVITRLGQPFNTHRSGGTGLGLYSCELFMSSIGGEMLLSNELEGAVVELRFL